MRCSSKATAIAFGILLHGNGAEWIDDMTFDVVGVDVPVTTPVMRIPNAPNKLDFDNRASQKRSCATPNHSPTTVIGSLASNVRP